MTRATRNRLCEAALLVAALAAPGMAQQVTGTPGSPDATTTISGKQLPPPDPKFGGVIKGNASQSKAWWPPRVVPPKGAPNVLLIMTDDVGFRRAEHVRRRHSHAGAGPHRQARACATPSSIPRRSVRRRGPR